MVYEVIKQLTSSDAERLRKIKRKESFLANVKDLPLLQIKKNNRIYRGEIIPSTKVGPFILQKNQFSRYNNTLFYDENNEPLNKGLTKFSVSAEEDAEYVIMLSMSYTYDTFSLFPSEKLNMGIMNTVAASFYNRRPLYQEILKKGLLPHRKKLIENTGEVFANNLINLFSVSKVVEKIEEYQVPSEILSAKLIEQKTIKYGTLTQLGYAGILCRSPGTGKSHIHAKTYLDSKNNLIIIADLLDSDIYTDSCFYSTLGRPWNSPKIELKNNQKLNNIINNQLDDYFASWEAITNFGMDIYDKVKINFLVDNL